MKLEPAAAVASAAQTLARTEAAGEACLQLLQDLNAELAQPLPAEDVAAIWQPFEGSRPVENPSKRFARVDPASEITLANCCAQLDRQLRWNLRAAALEIKAPKQKPPWQALDDKAAAILKSDIEQLLLATPRLTASGALTPIKPIKFPNQPWLWAVKALSARHEADPFLEYLEALPAWDGTKRIDTLFSDLFRSDSPADLVRWAARSVLVGAVRRAYRPGEKHDEVVVLIGPQGIGKSTIWPALLARDPRWFGDGLNLASDDKGRVEALLGKVLVESSELRGSRMADVDSLKAFISRSTDHIRLAYAHFPSDLPRRGVIVGSTNDEQCLPNDPSGNRRFVPIRVNGDQDTIAKLRKLDPDQLWAEALALHRERVPIYLAPAILPTHFSEAERHRFHNEHLETEVERAVVTHGKDGVLTLAQIFTTIGVREPKAVQQREVAGILKSFGCTRVVRRIDGRNTKAWDVAKMYWHLIRTDDPDGEPPF